MGVSGHSVLMHSLLLAHVSDTETTEEEAVVVALHCLKTYTFSIMPFGKHVVFLHIGMSNFSLNTSEKKNSWIISNVLVKTNVTIHMKERLKAREKKSVGGNFIME